MTDLSVAFELARRRYTTETEDDKVVNRALFGSDEDDEGDENAEDLFHDTPEQEDDHDQDGGHDLGGEADPAPVEPVPEEEGHVNAEGLNYQQPCTPFAGTIWAGKENGFPRIDQENHRRPSGQRPHGYPLTDWNYCFTATNFARLGTV